MGRSAWQKASLQHGYIDLAFCSNLQWSCQLNMAQNAIILADNCIMQRKMEIFLWAAILAPCFTGAGMETTIPCFQHLYNLSFRKEPVSGGFGIFSGHRDGAERLA
jgi:hypothetical protein